MSIQATQVKMDMLLKLNNQSEPHGTHILGFVMKVKNLALNSMMKTGLGDVM